ncbi:nitrogen fixation protein NifZ [Phaeovulum vinaykumarii]|uniref:Nitrogen fixation protein NifZ n=1 Tax=Phaeovulum vinaykumarii TaxID=407234 RepID=A0A1N7JX01_9RHOB|nr:nitrogen fixation protein NifZ [Phaeovulum vinaykumarii]SIS53850.1 nitrogen fixation protein NifZ [Phaeovulum vinaykumarii]SOB91731.1 nitrogen fixation protein NifZ [Phaeovulum vinaykumarii]
MTDPVAPAADRPEDAIEVYDPPAYQPGDKVQARISVRNDGTVWGVDIGEMVVHKGDVGYVRDIGTFLQRYYIYAIDFIDRGTIVGMRAKELVPDGAPLTREASRAHASAAAVPQD